MIEETIKLMGGNVYINIYSSKLDTELEIISFVKEELKKLVDKFNYFDSNSLISQLNYRRKILYDEDIAFMLKKGTQFYLLSNSLFNIFLGKSSDSRKNNQKTTQINLISPSDIFKISKELILLTQNTIKLDLGGIAKGYIIDKVIKNTRENFPTIQFDILIDARGDIALYRKNPVTIHIENPFRKGESFEWVKMKTGAIITSGHNRQSYKYGSHIIGDKTDIETITLISNKNQCYELDALGTYLIQLNSQTVLKKLEFDIYFKDIEGLLILSNGKVLKTSFFDMYKNGN